MILTMMDDHENNIDDADEGIIESRGVEPIEYSRIESKVRFYELVQ